MGDVDGDPMFDDPLLKRLLWKMLMEGSDVAFASFDAESAPHGSSSPLGVCSDDRYKDTRARGVLVTEAQVMIRMGH